MSVERHAGLVPQPVIFPECFTWQDQVVAARIMIDSALVRLDNNEPEATQGMHKLHELIYSHKIGIESPYEEFKDNAFSVFNGSVEYAQLLPDFPARQIKRGGKTFVSFDKMPPGVMNLRDMKLIADVYGLTEAPKKVKTLALPGMSNPNNALIEARFQLSLALRDKFRK